MFNIGPGELIVILIIALLVLGPDKLPEMARTVGKGMRELRKATEDLKDQVETEFYAADPLRPAVPPPLRAPPGSPMASAVPAPPPSAPLALPAAAAPEAVASGRELAPASAPSGEPGAAPAVEAAAGAHPNFAAVPELPPKVG